MPNPTDPAPPTLLPVNVLGPVQIGATPAPTDRARALTSVCVWLALHPDAAGCQLDRALAMSADSRVSALSRLRSWLGHDVVPTTRLTGRYRLHAITDWARVQELVCTSSGRLRDCATPQELSFALDLVRGEPLADIAAPWADSERIQMSLLLADVAHQLARHSIRTHRPDQATWALGQGILAAPEDDRLRRLARLLRNHRMKKVA